MSNKVEAKNLFKRYMIARIPLIVVQTIETGRAMDMLTEACAELVREGWIEEQSVFAHSLSKSIFNIFTNQPIGSSSGNSLMYAIDFMVKRLRSEQKTNQTLILTEVPDISGDNADSQRLLDLVTLASEMYGSIVVLTRHTVWSTLQRHGLIVKLDVPTEEEMYELIKSQLDGNRQQIPIYWDDSDIREAASTLSGVTQIEATNVMSALLARGEVKKEDMAEVRVAKNRLFSNISGLEKIDVDPDMKTVGGLRGLRDWLDEKKQLLRPEKKEEMKKRHLQPPRGILLVGVPGCGKSMSAKAISANWELPLYRLDFATVQGSYVGQSEQQLKDALSTAERVAPCILWIDEIEKGLSGAGSSNDGGVSTRMVGQFLFWLQECKKSVFVVATANDVSMLPSELLRRGRFDELFFVDLPTADERRDILSLYFKKYLEMDFSSNEELAASLVKITDGFTGADLESAVRDLAYRTIAQPDLVLDETEIRSTFENVVPLSKTSPEKIKSIRDWGKERAVPASGHPIGEEELPVQVKPAVRRVLVRHKEN